MKSKESVADYSLQLMAIINRCESIMIRRGGGGYNCWKDPPYNDNKI